MCAFNATRFNWAAAAGQVSSWAPPAAHVGVVVEPPAFTSMISLPGAVKKYKAYVTESAARAWASSVSATAVAAGRVGSLFSKAKATVAAAGAAAIADAAQAGQAYSWEAAALATAEQVCVATCRAGGVSAANRSRTWPHAHVSRVTTTPCWGTYSTEVGVSFEKAGMGWVGMAAAYAGREAAMRVCRGGRRGAGLRGGVGECGHRARSPRPCMNARRRAGTRVRGAPYAGPARPPPGWHPKSFCNTSEVRGWRWTRRCGGCGAFY